MEVTEEAVATGEEGVEVAWEEAAGPGWACTAGAAWTVILVIGENIFNSEARVSSPWACNTHFRGLCTAVQSK